MNQLRSLYTDEIRDFDAIPKGNHERLTPDEFELATRLLEKLSSDDLEPEAYTDEHRARVLAKIEEKKKGRENHGSPTSTTAGRRGRSL